MEGDFIYDAVKLGSYYFAIAVSKNLNLKIDKKYINSIRLAQVEFYEFDCLEVDKDFIIKKVQDILFCFPNQGQCDKRVEDVLKSKKLSNYSLNLDTLNIDNSSLILIALIFLFFNSFSILGIVAYKKELSNIEAKKVELNKYNLPLTSFQLDAIYENLKTIDNTQKLIRKDLEFFSRTPLKKNEEFKEIVFNNNVYKVEINTSKNLNNYFAKRFVIKSSKFSKNIYKAVLGHE